ncbi:MAG: hypothetical protein WCV90_05330 [Candidatus Woesearchaeota archaeon]
MEESELLKLMQEVAEEEGITIEAVLERMERNAKLFETPLAPSGRLSYVEGLIINGTIGPNQADMIIRKNHILQDEISELAEESKRTLSERYGIEIPDYTLQFYSTLNPNGPNVGKGLTSWVDRTLTLPTEGLIQIPIFIAHEQAHAYHMEESEIFRRLKAVYDPENPSKYEEIRQAGHFVIEGWASFFSGLYAKTRDERIGVNLYQRHLEEMNGFAHLLDIANRTDRRRYYEGHKIFEGIFEKHGLEGAKIAANTLITDEQLRRF